ncbi:MAG: thiolase family protein [Halobacteriota archaeon]|nr:thiolase family protein [Halobacteriota archaeon]
MREVVVLGAGLHRYGAFPEKTVMKMGAEAIRNALKDGNIPWEDIEVGYCGTARGSMSAGHFICRDLGLSGIGITNVENASASGSAAFREAFLAVASGANDTAIAIGADKLPKKPKKKKDKKDDGDSKKKKSKSVSFGPMQIFARVAKQHMKKYGTTSDQLAQVSVKSHYNASLNPYAHFQEAVTLEQVHDARMVADPLTVMHCCPWDDGGAAAIVCTKDIAEKYTDKICPEVTASVLKSTISGIDPMSGLTEVTANIAYEKAGIGPEDLDLVEMHDAFTIEEVIYCEALGLCEEGKGGLLAEEGVTALDGEHPVNSSGGLISMGHPLGPTGVGQVAEILWQMRGECGERQIKKPVDIAMAHMVGAGGVCVIHLFKK